MLFATIFIVFIKLPYHIWKLSHKLMGLAFLLGSLHALFIPSDISQNMILRIWVLIFIVLGLLSAFYIIFLYNTIGPKYIYCIKKIDQSTDIVNVYLMPIGRKLDFSPGQFIYISFKNEFVGEEHHPFSLSSAPGAESIRISVKKLGDFTHKLPLLQENEKVHVYGPYGKFGDWYKKRRESLILIAGGIGITPFLGMLKQNPPPLNKKITLFYCLRKRSEAVFLEEIKKNIENNPYINLHIWCSEESGRLNANKIRELLGEVNRNLIQVCGPPAMMESYKKQFMKQGISEKDIKLESFSQL
jgi:predicted ferric reductase